MLRPGLIACLYTPPAYNSEVHVTPDHIRHLRVYFLSFPQEYVIEFGLGVEAGLSKVCCELQILHRRLISAEAQPAGLLKAGLHLLVNANGSKVRPQQARAGQSGLKEIRGPEAR